MVHIELTIQRRHLIILAGVLLAAVMLIPGVAWATHSFADVPDAHIFADDIDWMKTAGVTQGCGDGTNYCPEANVTRGQMAAFMHRLSGSDNTTLDGRLDALEALLADVSRNGDILLFDGMNLQIVNGQGTTDTTNGAGNLIIGYNANLGDTRTGSHMLVVGDRHTYTSYGGIVSGYSNATTGNYSSVSGGTENTASSYYSSVTGGTNNTASGNFSSVTGGDLNTASGNYSSVTGGSFNKATGNYSSVSGGTENTASGSESSVSGGYSNLADKDRASVSGGYNNTAHANYVSILGGRNIIVAVQDGIYPGP